MIEPLADEYQKFVPASWWKDVTVYSQPAEQRVEGLRAQTIICWNCIDHAIGWREILDNMLSYGTHFHAPFVGHLGFERAEFEVETSARFEVVAMREPFGRDVGLLMRARAC